MRHWSPQALLKVSTASHSDYPGTCGDELKLSDGTQVNGRMALQIVKGGGGVPGPDSAQVEGHAEEEPGEWVLTFPAPAAELSSRCSCWRQDSWDTVPPKLLVDLQIGH